MPTRRPSDIAPSEITPREVYLRRREFIAGAAALGLGAGLAAALPGKSAQAAPLQGAKSPLSTTDEPPTALKDISSYNNYYEFGTDKGDPAKNAHTLKTKPWTVKVDGLVGKPADYDLDDLIKPAQLEERIYRMRCVEGWSMVIPWAGIPLARLLEEVRPTARAKYVAFETLYDPTRMPGQRTSVLAWPYTEGLRLDEAMHPLTLLATGKVLVAGGDYSMDPKPAPICAMGPSRPPEPPVGSAPSRRPTMPESARGAVAERAVFFERAIQLEMTKAGASIAGYFVTENHPNTFPALPVREGANVLVWFSVFADEMAYERHAAALADSIPRNNLADELTMRLKERPEVLRLLPTQRSRLHG
jgi:hypothetical protein